MGIRPLLYALVALAPTTWMSCAAADAAQLARWKAEITSLTRELSGELEQQQAEERKLRTIEIKLGETTRTLLELQTNAADLAQDGLALDGRARALKLKLKRQRRLTAALTRAAFSLSRRTHLQHFLAHSDPARTGRALAFARYLNLETARQLADLRDTADTLGALRQETAEKAEATSRTIVAARTTKTRLEHERQERSRVLAKVNLGIQSRRETLAKLAKDAARLARLVAGLGAAVARRPSVLRTTLAGRELAEPTRFSARKGQLPWPVAGALRRKYGTPRGSGNLRWGGDWFEAPHHTKVSAVAPGQIIFADWLRGFGLMVIVDHGEGFMSLYGHNATLLKETGDWVDSAEIIAHVGDSGGRADTGLYFELRRDGRPVDPVVWLAPQSLPQARRSAHRSPDG